MKYILMLFSLLLFAQSNAWASIYEYKSINDFKDLSSYNSIEEFEASYQKYVQDCLDNTGGGTGGISCHIGYEIWDRELNYYYKKIAPLLNKKELTALKESQRAWIKERDLSIEFNSMLLDHKYPPQGTMYALMRSGSADKLITPIIKQRTLVLKRWYELKNTNALSKRGRYPFRIMRQKQ